MGEFDQMLVLETGNRQAFEVVTNAVNAIGTYKVSRDRDALEVVLADLKSARQQDNRYLLVPYYIAVIEDLLGRSGDAAEQLRAILSETPTENPDLINEMRFNLAVAQYHGYSHECLQAAAATLDRVLGDTSTLYGRIKHFRLRLHSLALRSQVYAMWSIPKSPKDVENKEEAVRIASCYKLAKSNARAVFYSPMLLILALTDRDRSREIKAIAHNARGMAAMYYTDYFLESAQKLVALCKGLEHFTKSDQLFPRDWANYCDIGSCHMRLGYWGKDAAEFELARKYLTVVIQELRPDYGFALYEIGRSFRIQGRFDDALNYLQRAMAVPYRLRDVSNRRVELEIGLTNKKNSHYP